MSVVDIQGTLRRLNWRRQPKDLRDLPAPSRGPAKMQPLPLRSSTLHRAVPAIRDQGTLGSCTQNAGAAAMGFVYSVTTGKPDPLFSRLFGYYYTRVGLGGVPATEDSGCNVRDVFRAYRRWGLCLEQTWPYDITRFSETPPMSARAAALEHQALKFYACLTPHAIKKSIADGWPVIFGFDCFESILALETTKTGIIQMPRAGEGSLGGHCMLIDGYDDATQMFTGQNSWGVQWGAAGRFFLPYAYFTQGYAADAHTLRALEV